MTRRYAEGTTVSVDRSRAELRRILVNHGVLRLAWASEPAGDIIQFEYGGQLFRLRVAYPTAGDLATTRRPRNLRAALEAEWRRRWRAIVLLIKAKLEFADGETTSLFRELLPYAVLTDGRTLEEAVVSSDGPFLLAGRTQ